MRLVFECTEDEASFLMYGR